MAKYTFYKASKEEALLEEQTSNYTPFSKQITQYYIYKEDLANEDIDPRLLEVISDTNLDGLTPINPNKPMFPKK